MDSGCCLCKADFEPGGIGQLEVAQAIEAVTDGMRRRDAQRLDVLPERIHVVHHDSDVDPAGSCWCIRILGQEQSLAIPMDDGETACPPKQFKPERTVKRDRALEVRTDDLRTEERSVGKECVRTCRSRGSTEH